MPRPLRHVPPGALVEVTARTVGGRFLLRPSRDLNDIVFGLVARSARLYEVGVCSFTFLSNHFHMILLPGDGGRLADFMTYLDGNLAKEAGSLHDWREKFWGRRYHHSVISDEPEAQEKRLEYVLSQGCKEGLVKRPGDWPGASSLQAQLTGQEIRGLWFERSAEYEARRCGRSFSKYDFATEETLALTPIPCWADLSAREIHARTAEIALEIEDEARRRLRREGRSPMGRSRILNQLPHSRPTTLTKTAAPSVHAATAAVRRSLEHAYREFRAAFHQAADDLRAGRPDPEFPWHCFPPNQPFRRPPPSLGVSL